MEDRKRVVGTITVQIVVMIERPVKRLATSPEENNGQIP